MRGLSIIKKLYEYMVLYGGLLLFAIICLIWSLLASVLRHLLPRITANKVGQFVIMIVFRIYLWMIRVTGLVKYDLSELKALQDERAIILTTNHPSLIDVVLIASQLPRIVCVLKAELLENPLLGGGARMAGYIRNDTPASMIRDATDAVRRGDQMLIFPEGTRTLQLPINEFKGGVGLMAKKSGVPVQTLFIETNSPFLGKGISIWKKPEFPLRYRVRLGKRFEVDGDVKVFVSNLEQYYRDQLGAHK